MKNSLALFFLLVTAVHGFPNIPEVNVAEDVLLAPRLAIEDDNGNLIEVDLTANDTEDISDTSNDLVNRVIFYLHTVNNPDIDDAQQLLVNDVETLSQSYFDPTVPTRFVTHGWRSSSRSNSCSLIREAYLQHGEYNVIVVDWSLIASSTYIYASNRVKIVGEYVGQMIDFLATQGLDTTETIIVGHSLGGHVSGLAAYQANSTVGYVVALDPALPLFATAGSGERVAQGDANFVQIIHTNAGLLGYANAIGDVDFYPNGGTVQAGCVLDFSVACSHSRAFMFFAESINSDTGFVGTRCQSVLQYAVGSCQGNNRDIMGGAEPTTEGTGRYYLNTNASPPYAQGS